MPDWLFDITNPSEIRVLYLASYAPLQPSFEKLRHPEAGGYPGYHFNVYRGLMKAGFQVFTSRTPSCLMTASGNVDFVYSLLNRMPIDNSELLVSALCEYLRLPYLGASPAVRAVAENKSLFKLLARGLGIPTPRGVVVRQSDHVLQHPTISPPYFVKPLDGAASEGLSSDNLVHTWDDALTLIDRVRLPGQSFLVEEYCEGIDLTVPIVGATPFKILGYVHPLSDEPGSILTESLKLDDRLGYALFEPPSVVRHQIAHHARALWNSLGPIDYFRLDYRLELASHELKLLEMNICCHFEEDSAIDLAASRQNISFEQLLRHIVRYSLLRQQRKREHFKWVL